PIQPSAPTRKVTFLWPSSVAHSCCQPERPRVRNRYLPSANDKSIVRVDLGGNSCWAATCGVTCGPPMQKFSVSISRIDPFGRKVSSIDCSKFTEKSMLHPGQ